MKIEKVTENEIIFDNGNMITFDHEQDCCEHNFADFSVLNENNVYYNHEFSEALSFEYIGEEGFRFGSDGIWIFIPCYSCQNGYYSTEIDIYYCSDKVLSGICNEIID